MKEKKFWIFQIGQLAITIWILHIMAIENTRRFDIIDSHINYITFLTDSTWEGIYGTYTDEPIRGRYKGILEYLKEIQSGKIQGDEFGFIPRNQKK